MRTITLTQPWATLIAIGAKTIETRSWLTYYRGPLAIHAAKYKGNAEIHDTVFQRPFYKALTHGGGMVGIPSGEIVAVCTLKECIPTGQIVRFMNMTWMPLRADQERTFGDFSAGRFGWLLEDVRPLAEPIPAKGALGLWNWQEPDNLEDLLLPPVKALEIVTW